MDFNLILYSKEHFALPMEIPKVTNFCSLECTQDDLWFQVLRKCIWLLWEINQPIFFSRWTVYIHSFKSHYIQEALENSFLNGTFTQHTEHQIHNIGSLNTEPQFNFSSVRLKFKTDMSINLASMMEMT